MNEAQISEGARKKSKVRIWGGAGGLAVSGGFFFLCNYLMFMKRKEKKNVKCATFYWASYQKRPGQRRFTSDLRC